MSATTADAPALVAQHDSRPAGTTGQVRVLHVVPSLFGGGMERAMLRLIGASRQSRGETHPTPGSVHGVCVLQQADDALLTQCRSTAPTWVLGFQGPCRGKSRLKLIARLREVTAAFEPDVLHARTTSAWFDAAMAVRRNDRIRLLLSFHGKTDTAPPSFFRRWMNRRLCRRADGVLAVSHEAAEMMHKQWQIPEEQLTVIPNGVDTDRFHPAETTEHSATEGTGALRAACVANLVPVKAIDQLIAAWRQVVMAVPPAHLWLIGEGPLRGSLQALANRLRCASHVTFLGARDDVPDLLRQVDLFVLPSRYEGCSNAVLEAMATALPVVGFNTGAMSELVEPGRTGLLVPPGRVDQLASAIVTMLRDASARHRMGRTARKHVLEHHAMDRWLDAYTALYTRLGKG